MDRGHGFAKMSLQSLFALNGGALLAIPTFAKFQGLLKLDHWLIASVVAFAGGLLFTTIAAMVAFRTSYHESYSREDDLIPRYSDGTPIPPENYENDIDPAADLSAGSSAAFNAWWAALLPWQRAIVARAKRRGN